MLRSDLRDRQREGPQASLHAGRPAAHLSVSETVDSTQRRHVPSQNNRPGHFPQFRRPTPARRCAPTACDVVVACLAMLTTSLTDTFMLLSLAYVPPCAPSLHHARTHARRPVINRKHCAAAWRRGANTSLGGCPSVRPSICYFSVQHSQ